ncbi:MAG: MFS transporter [Erysipelotrichaceae bacterium]|nr:MFS transporter [Erysipelotrichaceae bacterium]
MSELDENRSKVEPEEIVTEVIADIDFRKPEALNAVRDEKEKAKATEAAQPESIDLIQAAEEAEKEKPALSKDEKKLAKEQKEISVLERALEFARHPKYFLLLVVILTIVYIADELTSNIKGYTQSFVIYDLFKTTINTPEFDAASSQLQLISTACYLILIIAPFYKSLADRLGRRLFLIINTIGMGIGMLVCALSTNFIMFIVGTVIMTFFTPNDVQVMYIMECAPAKHRAKIASLTKGIATMSVSLIGLLIKIFYNRADVASWRLIYIVPIAITLVVGIASIFIVKETPVYAEKRLEYLRSSKEERVTRAREAKEAAKEEKKNKVSVFSAFKYIFTHEQTLAIAIVGVIFSLSTGFTNVYGTVVEAGLGTKALSVEDTNVIYAFWPIINGIFTFLGGIISDVMGRKKSSLILGVWALIGLVMFVTGCAYGGSAYLIGFGYGFYCAGLWSISDLLYIIITAESVPTGIRASVMGCMSLIGMFGTGISWIINALVINWVGSARLGVTLMTAYLPVMGIALALLMLRVRETKGVDLSEIA